MADGSKLREGEPPPDLAPETGFRAEVRARSAGCVFGRGACVGPAEEGAAAGGEGEDGEGAAGEGSDDGEVGHGSGEASGGTEEHGAGAPAVDQASGLEIFFLCEDCLLFFFFSF